MKNGYTVVELLVVIAVFSVFYFWGVINTSHAFSYDKNQIAYEENINLIETMAKEYATYNEDLFEEKNTIYIYVDDLIENNYLKASSDGQIKDPRNINESLNHLKIKITKEDNAIIAKIVKLEI